MTTGTIQTKPKPTANVLRVTNTRMRQERRIRWTHGLSASQAALIAALVYGEAV